MGCFIEKNASPSRSSVRRLESEQTGEAEHGSARTLISSLGLVRSIYMYIYIYMYVYMYIYIYIYIYIYFYIFLHICIYIYVYIHTYMYIYIYTCICIYICICVSIDIHIYTFRSVYVCGCVCIYIYVGRGRRTSDAFFFQPRVGPVCKIAIHIGFGWPVAVPRTLPFSSVAMRLRPVPAGPVHSCVGAAGRFAAVCCVRGGGVPRDKIIIISSSVLLSS